MKPIAQPGQQLWLPRLMSSFCRTHPKSLRSVVSTFFSFYQYSWHEMAAVAKLTWSRQSVPQAQTHLFPPRLLRLQSPVGQPACWSISSTVNIEQQLVQRKSNAAIPLTRVTALLCCVMPIPRTWGKNLMPQAPKYSLIPYQVVEDWQKVLAISNWNALPFEMQRFFSVVCQRQSTSRPKTLEHVPSCTLCKLLLCVFKFVQNSLIACLSCSLVFQS